MFDLLKDATCLLCEGTDDSYRAVHLILEDAESPITRKTVETLFQTVTDRGHVDFGNIPNSKGDIKAYTGYQTLTDTLASLDAIAVSDESYKPLLEYTKIVRAAIQNIVAHTDLYKAAFNKKVDVIMLEYNAFVYDCVEAVTSILYQFVDFMKTPSSHTISAIFKNTKYRADLFFIEQLKQFNKICGTGHYKKYLASVIANGTENLTGAMIVGSVAVVTSVMLSIVPVTRKVIYTIQNLKGRIAEDLELQAYFLELNASYLKANKTMDEQEKQKILKKQENLRLKFTRMAEKMRVKSVRAEELAKKTLHDENKTMSMDDMRDSASNDDDFTIM